MNEFQTILSDTANRLFTDNLTKDTRIAAEDGTWPQALWQAVEENGFCRILVSEARGGAGASWSDAMVLLKACGLHAVPLPLAETIVAAWFLDQAGLDVPDGPLTFGPAELEGEGADTRLAAPMRKVPYAAEAAHVVAIAPAGDGVTVALLSDVTIAEPAASIARDPVADVTAAGIVSATGKAALPQDAAMQAGALMRAAGIAGALQAALAQAVQYAGERVQFGRPISKFQAIQHQLAEMATHAASVGVAADVAARAMSADPTDAAFEIAAAKLRAADAAQLGASIAHQTHGAIGFTYEHGLHFWTRRLWSWGPEFGGASHWARVLGRQAIADGGKALWASVTAR
jgi:acyl-CoA dehydrogenase